MSDDNGSVLSTEDSKDKRLENLKPPWKPGESGNPRGRPKRRRFYGEIARELLASQTVDVTLTTSNGKKKQFQLKSAENFAYLMAVSQLRRALEGDTQACEQLLSRAEGKPLSRQEILQKGAGFEVLEDYGESSTVMLNPGEVLYRHTEPALAIGILSEDPEVPEGRIQYVDVDGRPCDEPLGKATISMEFAREGKLAPPICPENQRPLKDE